MRTIIDIPDPQRDALDALCAREGISRAEAIRRAIAEYIESERKAAADEAWKAAFGIWKDRGVDTDTYLAEIRAEWDRDDDRDAVR